MRRVLFYSCSIVHQLHMLNESMRPMNRPQYKVCHVVAQTMKLKPQTTIHLEFEEKLVGDSF